ncbi:HK97 gp10 family phage protein [bacterium]|nr:HK97 gp10 family phage protein [bacterium]
MDKDPFFLDVKKFADGFSEGAETAVRVTAYKTFNNIIKRTPVDEGRARANWFATGQQPSSKKTDKEDNSADGKDTAKNAENVVLRLKDWSTFTLTNNLPYINPLEFGLYGSGPKTVLGFSSQSVGGMVRISILQSNMLLEQEAKKYLPK